LTGPRDSYLLGDHPEFLRWNPVAGYAFLTGAARRIANARPRASGEGAMSLGTILIIIVILYLLGGWSGRFGGYGYGLGHSGMGLGGVILVVLLVLLLLGKL
jgi:Protein of unknown function (DUF3309)